MTVRQVGDRVWNLGGGVVNCYAVEEGGRLTLVDTGLHGGWGRLLRGLEAIGRGIDDVEAVLLTHAHRDHTGTAARVHAASGAGIRVHSDDAPFVSHGGFAFAPGVPAEGGWAFGPGVLRVLARILACGVAARSVRFEPVLDATALHDGERVDVPGRPDVYHAPGHTPGSSVFHIASRGVLFTGDALVTRDMVSLTRGPQLNRRAFNYDHAQAVDSLAILERIEARTILPGHGDPWAGGGADAVAAARQREHGRSSARR